MSVAMWGIVVLVTCVVLEIVIAWIVWPHHLEGET